MKYHAVIGMIIEGPNVGYIAGQAQKCASVCGDVEGVTNDEHAHPIVVALNALVDAPGKVPA